MLPELWKSLGPAPRPATVNGLICRTIAPQPATVGVLTNRTTVNEISFLNSTSPLILISLTDTGYE